MMRDNHQIASITIRKKGAMVSSMPNIRVSSSLSVACSGRCATMPQPVLRTGAKPASISIP
ncbi:hypothetical protein D3C77_653550 [compost metagenome]